MKRVIVVSLLMTIFSFSCFLSRGKDYAGILGELYLQDVKAIKLPEECINKIVHEFEDSLKIKAHHVFAIRSNGFEKAIFFGDVEKNYIKEDMRYTGTEYLIILDEDCEIQKIHSFKHP